MTDDEDPLDAYHDELATRLPEELRETWAVVPRSFLYQLTIVGALFGTSLTMSICGKVFGVEWMTWAFPVAFALLMLLRKLWPWWRGDRSTDQLRAAAVREGLRPPGPTNDDRA